MTLDNILEEIKKAEKIVILTHEHPDGDAIGSSLAMYHALKAFGKNPDVIIPVHSKVFNCLPGVEDIKTDSNIENYDLAISLDCATIKMLNGFVNYFENAKVKVCIDHHSTNTMFGDYNYVNPAAPACAQILLVILEYFGIEMTKEIGTCILTGIITDTGGFRYEGVTSETFEIASSFLEKGINISKIYKDSVSNISREKFEARKLAANRIEFLEDGKIAYTYMTREDMINLNVARSDLEGIVENGRDVEGVEVSVFLYETDKGYKASLRSNSYVNVSDVCLLFNGGGHVRAAGCTLACPLDEAKSKILKEIRRVLK